MTHKQWLVKKVIIIIVMVVIAVISVLYSIYHHRVTGNVRIVLYILISILIAFCDIRGIFETYEKYVRKYNDKES